MRKKTIILVMLLAVILSVFIGYSIAYFTSIDVNRDNYIRLGKFDRKKANVGEYALQLFLIHGRRVDIVENLFILQDEKYDKWIESIREGLVYDYLNNTSTIRSISQEEYLKNQNIIYEAEKRQFKDNQFHWIAVLTNNKPKYPNNRPFSLNDIVLDVNQSVTFRDIRHSKMHTYKDMKDMDFIKRRLFAYFGKSYRYDSSNHKYVKVRENQDSDLIIIDLATCLGFEFHSINIMYNTFHTTNANLKFIDSKCKVDFKPFPDDPMTMSVEGKTF